MRVQELYACSNERLSWPTVCAVPSNAELINEA